MKPTAAGAAAVALSGAAMDEHWKAAAADLGRLFAVMRGVDPRNLGSDPQRTLAGYEPPPGLWSDADRALRDRFVAMDRRVFDSVYATWLRRA